MIIVLQSDAEPTRAGDQSEDESESDASFNPDEDVTNPLDISSDVTDGFTTDDDSSRKLFSQIFHVREKCRNMMDEFKNHNSLISAEFKYGIYIIYYTCLYLLLCKSIDFSFPGLTNSSKNETGISLKNVSKIYSKKKTNKGNYDIICLLLYLVSF